MSANGFFIKVSVALEERAYRALMGPVGRHIFTPRSHRVSIHVCTHLRRWWWRDGGGGTPHWLLSTQYYKSRLAVTTRRSPFDYRINLTRVKSVVVMDIRMWITGIRSVLKFTVRPRHINISLKPYKTPICKCSPLRYWKLSVSKKKVFMLHVCEIYGKWNYY